MTEQQYEYNNRRLPVESAEDQRIEANIYYAPNTIRLPVSERGYFACQGWL